MTETEERHTLGDHRLCEACGCPHAAQWHGPVLEAARTALERTGRRYAVLCIECTDQGRPRVLGTVRRGWDATGLRNSHWRRHGGYQRPNGLHAMKGVVYIVDSEPRLRLR